MEDALRPHGIGVTQWYVLHHLANIGPTKQRELAWKLSIERATVSAVVAALVAKSLVEQVQDHADLRQKLLQLTPKGRSLWAQLPDLNFIPQTAFADISPANIATTINVLRTATERLDKRQKGTAS